MFACMPQSLELMMHFEDEMLCEVCNKTLKVADKLANKDWFKRRSSGGVRRMFTQKKV